MLEIIIYFRFSSSKPASFVCAHYDCAEYFGRGDPDCTLTYNEDSCCSTGRVCGEAKAKADKCYLEGKEYIVGQRIYPASRASYKCLCRHGFDNSTIVGNPNCKEMKCGFEMHYGNQLRDGCIPIYYDNNKRCAIDWRCRKFNFLPVFNCI